jgi:hypothetical protein
MVASIPRLIVFKTFLWLLCLPSRLHLYFYPTPLKFCGMTVKLSVGGIQHVFQ